MQLPAAGRVRESVRVPFPRPRPKMPYTDYLVSLPAKRDHIAQKRGRIFAQILCCVAQMTIYRTMTAQKHAAVPNADAVCSNEKVSRNFVLLTTAI